MEADPGRLTSVLQHCSPSSSLLKSELQDGAGMTQECCYFTTSGRPETNTLLADLKVNNMANRIEFEFVR